MTYFQKIENVNEIRTHPVFARGSPETVGPPATHACRSDGRSSARSWGAPPLGVLLHGRGPGLKVEPSWRVHEDWGTGAARSGSGLQRLLAVGPDAWVHFTSPGVIKLHVALP